MSFQIEKVAVRNSSFATPGESYLILANSASLRRHLTDSYWCDAMDQVCSGKLKGVAVRYTGENLVLLQFRPLTLSPAGYRYPLFMSIPIEFLVPATESAFAIGGGSDLQGSFGTASASSVQSASDTDSKSPTTGAAMPKLCVVCGRFNTPEMVQRPHGWKCKECKGKKSDQRLRQELQKLKDLQKPRP
ncbi:hypothetical protein ABB37_03401 [Leptomonas pyrrhocoris]|uniref:Uncharacterized protein n=1 Tax=Leptomonas pyrrhocoris TaxID=157538 RepID=A0A0M9G4K5_LEPPY|nr:hypothetical protein ABB37_03401 [Leptomonas pyrrhocoris]XP_015660740.1 hypothetical protein ABB37_03401 [Leptomonas pyrrhocoris]KPA82300.1 hypothetical protein ABB37_03401 [Leptomonas pyrrhocoris]KPA82301.1 hypothetical protein ABB37_03401 [Leptomonas pyrrhocoris]|eukprot:XP_015660739.1 hypothetical protein ABB37_03401 [Leptomonas pyrrhocoris]